MTGASWFDPDRLARIGPFFLLHVGRLDPGAGWQPIASLTDDTVDAHRRVDQLVDDVAVRLGTSTRWIGASVLFLGWAAHLTSIYAGSIVLGGATPDLSASRLLCRTGPHGRVELGTDDLVALDAGAGWTGLTEGHLSLLAAALRRQVRIGYRLLEGNIASALAGSLSALARAGHAPLDQLVDQPWARPPDLAPYGRWVPASEGLRFARRTCCGYERLPEGDRCGDCSLRW